MPVSSFPAVISFADKKERSIVLDSHNERSFSQKMADAIAVEEIDTNLFMSKELWLPLGSRGVFGGQIVAQALRAAWNTVPDEFYIHSLHSYFILAGNVEVPVLYQVQRLRQGRSYATRIVTATQKGKAIFVCTCSFAKVAEDMTLEHQTKMPDVVGPEMLPSDDERVKGFLSETEDLHPKLRDYLEKRLEEEQPIDYRALDTYTPGEMMRGSTEASNVQHRWFKTREKVGDDYKLHACIIAYASDSHLLMTAALANGVISNAIGMMTSLDHSIWFHAPTRADEWLLYDMNSPRTNSGRGISFGRIFSRDGTLVATTAQEGIVRLSRAEQARRLKIKKASSAEKTLLTSDSKL